jgi:glycosyltransferase involved in cell wall biosynthesis
VDDGSTDGTKRLVQQKYGNRVNLIDGPQSGAGPARNAGIAHAKTKLIAFLDADDIWRNNKLEKQLEIYEPGTVLGTYAEFFVSTKRGRRFFGTSIRTQTDEEADRLIHSGLALPVLLSSWLFEREAMEKVGAFDPDYIFAQDFEIAIRLSIGGFRFKVIRENLLEYRIHQTSETYTNYISQRMFADYSKYRLVDNGDLNLDDWTKNFWTRAQLRRARAGFYFRLGLGGLGRLIPIRAALSLLIAFVLDPTGFLKKFSRQASIGLLLRNSGSKGAKS